MSNMPWIDAVNTRRRALYAWLDTDKGRAAVAALAEIFDADDLLGATPENTYFNLGSREVVRFMKHIAEGGELAELSDAE